MKKIAIATATRAEYGILHPLLVRLMEEKEFDVQLLVTGTHLEERFGYTVKEIEKDGLLIARKIPILVEDNSPYGISVTMAQAITGLQIILKVSSRICFWCWETERKFSVCVRQR